MKTTRAVVLLSGGLDSATTLWIAKREGFRELFTLSFDYGQRHRFELSAARKLSENARVAKHVVVKIDLSAIGGSALTDKIPVPHGRTTEEVGSGIPLTYVPARNTVFLAVALGWAEVLGTWDIFIGVNAVDYSGYPDCRPEFIDAFSQLAQIATKAGVEGRGRFNIHAPLIHLTKSEIIRRGLELGVDYELTHSCYDPNAEGQACGTCDACQIRLHGFAACNVIDPIRYQSIL